MYLLKKNEEVKDSVSSVISEKHKEPQHGSSSQPVTEKSICDKAKKTGKAKRMVTHSRGRTIEEEERMLQDSTTCETSDMSKAISERETNKYCERTEKMPNLQKYEDRGQKAVYGTEIADVVMDNTEGRKTETKEQK
jgi:hypothetical protein